MINTKMLDELSAKFSEMLSHSPAKDLEKNAKAVFAGVFSRLDLVTREEFEVQREVLTRTRERLAQLEARVAELEARKLP
jgi:BMFP domain-containing protein YqiC